MTAGEAAGSASSPSVADSVSVGANSLGGEHAPVKESTGQGEGRAEGHKDAPSMGVAGDPAVAAKAAQEAAAVEAASTVMPPPPKREQREELGLVEQLTNMVEVFDICDLLRRVSASTRPDKPGASGTAKSPHHLRQMSVDTDSGVPTSPQSGERSGLPSLASMELTRDSSRDWDTLMAGSADMSDLGNTMVQSVAEFFSF